MKKSEKEHKEYINRILINHYYPEDDVFYCKPNRMDRLRMFFKSVYFKIRNFFIGIYNKEDEFVHYNDVSNDVSWKIFKDIHNNILNKCETCKYNTTENYHDVMWCRDCRQFDRWKQLLNK